MQQLRQAKLRQSAIFPAPRSIVLSCGIAEITEGAVFNGIKQHTLSLIKCREWHVE